MQIPGHFSGLEILHLRYVFCVVYMRIDLCMFGLYNQAIYITL